MSFLARLGLDRNCTEADVRAAFLKRAQAVHPDHGGSKQAFQQLKRDYDAALQFAKSPQKAASTGPHNATIRTRTPRAYRQRRGHPLLLGAAAIVALLGCLLFSATLPFVVSLLFLAVFILLLGVFGLPAMPRAYATILYFTTVFLSGTLVFGLAAQGEYHLVYRLDRAEMTIYDWVMAGSPFYVVLLWVVGFCGWTASLSKS